MAFHLQVEKNLRNSKEAFGDVQLFKTFEKKAAMYFAQVSKEIFLQSLAMYQGVK